MNTEDLFKYGVTPKEGEFAGEKFIVENINPCVVFCFREKDPTHKEEFTHGSYDIWHEPKTLFEDDSIVATWGNLKKAMEKAGLSDDTRIKVPVGFWLDYGCKDADARIISVDGKSAVYFY